MTKRTAGTKTAANDSLTGFFSSSRICKSVANRRRVPCSVDLPLDIDQQISLFQGFADPRLMGRLFRLHPATGEHEVPPVAPVALDQCDRSRPDDGSYPLLHGWSFPRKRLDPAGSTLSDK